MLQEILKTDMRKIVCIVFIIFLSSCGALSQQTNDKLKARTDQLVSKSADAMFDRLDRVIPGILREEGTRAVLPEGMKLRKTTNDGIQLAMNFEGWEPVLYNDPVGYCTVGYGHLIKKAPCNGNEPNELNHCPTSTVGELKKELSNLRGEQILRCDMAQAETLATLNLRPDLPDHRYAAMVDMIFNIGPKFVDSTAIRMVNEGNYAEVPAQLMRWVYANGKYLKGLEKRRRAAVALWLGPEAATRGETIPSAEPEQAIDIYVGEQ